jgi:hypothetical protein
MVGMFLLMALFVGFLLLLPLMIVGLLLRLIFGLAVLPLKLAGFVIKLTFGLVAGLVGLVVGLALLAVFVVTAGAFLLIPLLPIVLIGGAAWIAWRILRPKPRPNAYAPTA